MQSVGADMKPTLYEMAAADVWEDLQMRREEVIP